MSNIDEKTIAGLLDRIDAIKKELTQLEDEIKALQVDAGEPSGPGRVHSRSAAAEYGLGPEATPAAAAGASLDGETHATLGTPREGKCPLGDLRGNNGSADGGTGAERSEASGGAERSEAVEPPELAPVVPEPAEEPEEEPIDIAPVDDTPIDISITDVDDMPADSAEPFEPGGSTPLTNLGSASLSSRSLSEVEGPAPEPKKAILDTAKADTAVMDVMAEKQAWRTDRPGMPVKNIISAISLNDRVFLINTLFGEDPMLFQETISKFNAMGSLSEALAYIGEKHPDWDMNSDAVYRLMMAVRRKLS